MDKLLETPTPAAYQVHLESFDGPLDLLLHLVHKNEMDIYDISMAQITRQYLEYLDQMKEHNLDIASEFLVMAATLMHIKSRMLLPRRDPDEGEEDEIDPRAELVQRLLEYRRYKDGAEQLEGYPQLNRDVFVRPDGIEDVAEDDPEPMVHDVGVYDLVKALRELLEEAPAPPVHAVSKSALTVAQGLRRLLARLRHKEMVSFRDCFAPSPQRDEIVIIFIAVLELVKLQLCRVVQLNQKGTLYLYPAESVRRGEVERLEGVDHGYQ
ncbi:segregation and condensation protein A [Desulfuromonas acetoxidans]|uniref:Segregation and condensation protein A n=1 Tax=Desulfuromonas acetoxidans (strain DSM 684 / 11070) TaxID=281689 RepID=Q1JVP2_DESA6|nr:chromosome segregation and condensation protein ScpA [Desulfuromonas acetoxidans DSM 684]